MVEPQSIRLIDESKRVFPTLLSHFFYRACSSMGLGVKVEQVLTFAENLNRFSLAGLGVEKKDGKGTTSHSRSISFSEYGMKNFFDFVFFEEESFVHASFSLL